MSSLTFLTQKAFYLCVSLFIVMTLTFVLMKAVPGDPFSDEQSLPKEIQESLRLHYGLDQPWHMQYLYYLKSILTWNLGPSFKYQDRTVNDIISEGFPTSALLGIEALLIAIVMGTLLGTIAALKENQWQDYMIIGLTTLAISVPSFVMANLLQYVFALKWHLLPIARWGSLAHSILPALALAALPTAFIMRLLRASLIDVLQCEYIRAAKAKGLSHTSTILKHGLKNAFLPVFAYLGQLTTSILVGSFVIEKIFSIPGLGRWFVNSVSSRDYPVIMGLTVFYSFLLMSIILLIDIAYSFLDPRIQLNHNENK